MNSFSSSFRFSGVKRAVLVGVNYVGQRKELQGPVNDVKLIHNYLVSQCAFEPRNILLCTDVDTGILGVTRLTAKKADILMALSTLIDAAEPGDSLWFSFSGHGDKTWDTSGDETDGFDQTILPMDHATAGHIIDDEMYAIVRQLPEGARLTAVFDCCNGGTSLDLPYRYKISPNGIQMKDDSQVQAPCKLKIVREVLSGTVTGAIRGGQMGKKSKGIRGALFGAARGAACGAMELATSDPASVLCAGRYLVTGEGQTRTETVASPIISEILYFSGCKDYMPSTDCFNEELGVFCGVMTSSFLSVVQAERALTYRELLYELRDKLKPVLFMAPQFSTSHPFDLDKLFYV